MHISKARILIRSELSEKQYITIAKFIFVKILYIDIISIFLSSHCHEHFSAANFEHACWPHSMLKNSPTFASLHYDYTVMGGGNCSTYS